MPGMPSTSLICFSVPLSIFQTDGPDRSSGASTTLQPLRLVVLLKSACTSGTPAACGAAGAGTGVGVGGRGAPVGMGGGVGRISVMTSGWAWEVGWISLATPGWACADGFTPQPASASAPSSRTRDVNRYEYRRDLIISSW